MTSQTGCQCDGNILTGEAVAISTPTACAVFINTKLAAGG